MRPRPPIALLLAALVAGCESFPQIDGTVHGVDTAGAYPALVPVEELRAAAARPAQSTAPSLDEAARFEARAARLRARAARLRGETVLDDSARDRLNNDRRIDTTDGT